jgi:hypothetical protein
MVDALEPTMNRPYGGARFSFTLPAKPHWRAERPQYSSGLAVAQTTTWRLM